MNNPTQQAELYRKAAETIEMCAHHWIEAKCKYLKSFSRIEGMTLIDNYDHYEFPLAVIEGQLVWADTIIYNELGHQLMARQMSTERRYTLSPPKQPLCEVEGKPVYKGSKLFHKTKSYEFIVASRFESGIIDERGNFEWLSSMSWDQPKRTVMVELQLEDAESFKYRYQCLYPNRNNIQSAIDKALDNLK